MAIIESSSSPQSQSVSDRTTLPTEILIDILLKLPVESLLRCKSVCKSWFSLISEPRFVKSHLNFSAHNNTRLISNHRYYGKKDVLNNCCRKQLFAPKSRASLWIYNNRCLNDVMNGNFIDNAIEVVDYPFESCGESVRVVGSCNGLVCLNIFRMEYDGILFIWNPSTRKYHKLPSHAYPTELCEPHIAHQRFGFGYDDSSDDYKVVSLSYRLVWMGSSFKLTHLVKMYSLRNGSWKDIGLFSECRPSDLYGTFVNGALHWAVQNNDDHWKIISLDLATGTYGEVLQPVYDEGHIYLELGYLGEWLCVICHYNCIRVDLFAMKVYGVKDFWTKLVSITYGPEKTHNLAPLFISNDERILLIYGFKLMIYDSKNGSFSDVESFDKYLEAFAYVESLVSPTPPAAALGHRVAGFNG